MSQPTYNVTCPNCGGALQPVALDPQTAPWLCYLCHRGFWTAELTREARAIYRPQHFDFGHGAAGWGIRAAIAIEQGEAEVRGTSLREDQLFLVPVAAVHALNPKGPFASIVQAALKQRGA